MSTSLWLLKILTSSSRAGFYFENPEVRNRKGTWSGLAIRRLGSFWPTLCQRGESFLWSGWNSQRRGILPFLAKLKRHTLKMHELRQIFTLHTWELNLSSTSKLCRSFSNVLSLSLLMSIPEEVLPMLNCEQDVKVNDWEGKHWTRPLSLSLLMSIPEDCHCQYVNCEQDVKVKDLEGAQGHYQPLSKALCLSSVNLAHISLDHEQVLEPEFLNDIFWAILT